VNIRSLLAVVLLYLFIPFSAHATSSNTSISATYTVQSNDEKQTKAVYAIDLEEPEGAHSTSEYSLHMPTSFPVTSIHATVDTEPVEPVISSQQNYISVSIPLPDSDKKIHRLIELSFLQGNVVHQNGKQTEVLIPTLLTKTNETIRYQLSIPSDLTNTLLSSRPMFSQRNGANMFWSGTRGKTIQVMFGAPKLFYHTSLQYDLQNESGLSRTMDITLPPESPYQLLHDISFSEKPLEIGIDSDGNPIARYTVAPHGKKSVKFRATLELRVLPDGERVRYDRLLFQSSREHLLRPFIGEERRTPPLKDPRTVYEYTVASLSYDYSQLSTPSLRTAHKTISQILNTPTKSICIDYSSLFVNLARKNGIEAREVYGYSIQRDEQLRPTNGDELHSWAQFFDTTTQQWVNVDPTWDDTSSLDYYNFQDFNHVVLAYRGADSNTPYPAGFFRFNNSSDTALISIVPSAGSEAEADQSALSIDRSAMRTSYNASEPTDTTVSVLNAGTSVRYNVPVSVTSRHSVVHLEKQIIPILYPLQKVALTLSVTGSDKLGGADALTITAGERSEQISITVLPRSYLKTIVLAVSVLSVITVLWIVGRRRK